MRAVRHCLAALAALISAATSAGATSLQISPVLVDMQGAASAEKVTLKNLGGVPINAQIRVFKWTQKGGKDVLEPTRDVVASPPIAAIAAGGEQIVRIVRVDRTPLAGETSYRLLVDQLPDQSRSGRTIVNFLMRYSIPVFFAPEQKRAGELAFSVQSLNGKVVVTATNPGDRRVRVAELGISGQSGTTVAARKGLVGYVLGRSTATWELPGASLARGAAVTITAQGDDGPIKGAAVAR